jgi:ribulose bisphosphate carboxylase small subunit
MSYYIAPRFLNKLSVHVTKNFLDLSNVKIPLILGIHGRKGEGKSFMCELIFKRMGIGVVYMSGGELESPDAGDPARLIRLRYREAGEWSKVHGKMAALLINDVDAGIGRVDQYTQYTVNTQLVNATLMNIADNPTNVQLPGSYDQEPTRRVPIILTGNDFSTLYAPLIRDGRMEKFYWEPDRSDRIGIVSSIFKVDQVAQTDIETLIDTFPDQAIDFFGALRSRLYDEQVFQFIQAVGLEKVSTRVVNSKEPPPEFHQPDFRLSHLIEVGNQLVAEQSRIKELRLVEEYNKFLYNRRLGETAEEDLGTEEQRRRRSREHSDFFRAYPASSPNGQSSPSAHPPISPSSATSYVGQPSSTKLNPEMVTEVNRILAQGHRIGIEYVDDRRFRTGAWNCYGTYQDNPSEALRALEVCLSEHTKDYVRLVDITPERRRMGEAIVQRPNARG